MLTYDHIIRQLTERDKITLLTNIHSMADAAMGAKGVPCVEIGAVQEACGNLLPSPRAMSRSFDVSLTADVACGALRAMAENGIRHGVIPGAAVRTSPLGGGLTEDPFLSGELAGAWLTGATRAGMSVSPDGYGAEGEISPRYAYTYFYEPYRRALEKGACAGVLTEQGEAFPAGERNPYAFRLRAGAEDTVRAIADGVILFEGSAPALEQALRRYRRMQEGVGLGLTSTGELTEAVEKGEVMSGETLDLAVDRLLSFAHSCAATQISDGRFREGLDQLARRGARASVTLLENAAVGKKAVPALPLAAGTTVFTVGDVVSSVALGDDALKSAILRSGLTFGGFARGYGLSDTRSDGLLQEAVAAAEGKEHILLFLGTRGAASSAGGRADLPPNQRALCYALSQTNLPMTLILTGDVDWDLSFLSEMIRRPAAILLADLSCFAGVEAAMEAVAGVYAPEGRLTSTLTARTTGLQRPAGMLRGYRYYDTVGYGEIYPFGHGLTYTTFRYRDLRVENGFAVFTVKNVGDRAGVEIPQVYMGIKRSAVLRPRKELVGFARVELAPDEEKTVTIPISPVAVFDESRGEALVEKGTYRVFVGASVKDIRLTATAAWSGEILSPDGEDPADHLPSVSNIVTQHYGMEAAYTPMKSSYRNLVFGIASLVLGVGLKTYDIITAADALFLDIVAGLLAVGAVAFFVLEIIDRKRRYALLRREMEAANEALFAGADTVSVPSAAALFGEDLYVPEESEQAEQKEMADTYDPMADVDTSLTFGDAAGELSALAARRGLALEQTSASHLLAAMASSRLLLVRGLSGERLEALASVLGEYFDSSVGVDSASAMTCEADVLFSLDENGQRVPRHTLTALEAARSDPRKIHVAALSDVSLTTISTYFVPFARHASAPRAGMTVTVPAAEEGSTETYAMAQNLWFMLSTASDQSISDLPDSMAETAAVLTLDLQPCIPAESDVDIRPFGYAQLEYLTERAKAGCTVGEDVWKRLDRLEAYAGRLVSFRMSNKLWVSLETALAVCMAAGESPAAALDAALAIKLLPALIPALSGRIPRGEVSLTDTLESALGEGNTPLCRKLLKETGGF